MFFSLPYVIFRLLSYVSECKFRHYLFTLQIFFALSTILFSSPKHRRHQSEYLYSKKPVFGKSKRTAETGEQRVRPPENRSFGFHGLDLRCHLEFFNLHACRKEGSTHLDFLKRHSAPVRSGILRIWRQINHCSLALVSVHRALLR